MLLQIGQTGPRLTQLPKTLPDQKLSSASDFVVSGPRITSKGLISKKTKPKNKKHKTLNAKGRKG